MRQDLPQRDRLLAALRKLRPDARDRRVEIDLVACDQAQHADRAERLADRKEIDERVASPRLGAQCVAPPAPEIGDDASVDGARARSTRFAAAGKILRERIALRVEPRIAEAVDVHSGSLAGASADAKRIWSTEYRD